MDKDTELKPCPFCGSKAEVFVTDTAPCIIGTFVGKPVTRAEALQISRRIIERAEKERLEYAAREAAQLFQWDEEA